MYNKTRVINVEGIDMTIFESPDLISDEIVRSNRFWEYRLMEKWMHHFPNQGLMLDIGANIGNHCLMFKKAFPDLKIWAFEMSYNNFTLLYKNILPYHEIKCFNVALSNDIKIIGYNDSETNNNGNIILQNANDVRNYNVSITLDSLTMPEQVKFIKIDIEEHEIYAFEGMRNLLLKDKPLIWVEDWVKFGKITGHFENQNTEGNLSSVDYLISLGYEIIDEDRCDFLLKFNN
jgi:FkbM family methyltransferase